MNFLGHPIRAKFTPLNRVPFGKFNGVNGPRKWANPKLSKFDVNPKMRGVLPYFKGLSTQLRMVDYTSSFHVTL
jgi:hypothetical protein